MWNIGGPDPRPSSAPAVAGTLMSAREPDLAMRAVPRGSARTASRSSRLCTRHCLARPGAPRSVRSRAPTAWLVTGAAGGIGDMDVLITGGNGLLGRHLVEALQDRGDSVRVLALPEEDIRWLRDRGITVHRGDVRWPDTLATPMSGATAVVHLAGMMGVWRSLQDYRDVNVTGTRNVCGAALAERVSRIVHVSSWTVYGMDLGRPAQEDFLLKPFHDPYAITKTEGDLAVQRMIAEDHLPAVIIRPGTFIGPGDHLHFGRMADRLRAGKGIIIGGGDNALPFVYVTDVVQGLLLALDCEHAVGQAYNISNDHPMTQQQLLEAIAHDIGVQAPTLH